MMANGQKRYFVPNSTNISSNSILVKITNTKLVVNQGFD